jgi:hypothetical protein
MSTAFVMLILDAAVSLVPIIYVANYLRKIGKRPFRLVPGFLPWAVYALAPGAVSFAAVYVVDRVVLGGVLSDVNLAKVTAWIICTFIGLFFYSIVQIWVIEKFVQILPGDEETIRRTVPVCLHVLALSAYSGLFIEDAGHSLVAFGRLAMYLFDRSAAPGILDDEYYLVAATWIYSLLSCLWLRFLTSTAFTIFEETVGAPRKRRAAFRIFFTVMLLCFLMSMEITVIASALVLVSGNSLMLRHYRLLRTTDDGRRP